MDAGQANIVTAVLASAPRDKPMKFDPNDFLVRPRPKKREPKKHDIQRDFDALVAWAKSTKRRG